MVIMQGCPTVTLFTVLVAAEAFDEELDGASVAQAIGRGMSAGNPELKTDLCPTETPKAPDGDEQSKPRCNLDSLGFDTRMRRSRAVVVATPVLDHNTLLRASTAFEIATRARQSGVPCYAITGRDDLDLFQARILDLQVVLEAGDARELRAAGKRLARVA
jgi:glycerate kinase